MRTRLVLSPPALPPMPPSPLLPLLLLFLGAAAGSGAQTEELHQEQRAAAGGTPACTVYHPTNCCCEPHFLVLVTVNLRTGCNLLPPLAVIAQAPDPALQV